MHKRHAKELEDFYKKLELKKNDKVQDATKRQKNTLIGSQTLQEHKSSNGQNLKTPGRKQAHQSDENITKLQKDSVRQFEEDMTMKKGGSGAIVGWSTNKHAFNPMKGQPGAATKVMNVPRVTPLAVSSSVPHLPQSSSGYIAYTSASTVFSTSQTNIMHGKQSGQLHHQLHGEKTGVYWANGSNPHWQANIETGNGRGQPVAYADTAGPVTDMNSWPVNGSFHAVASLPPQQVVQTNNPTRPNEIQMMTPTDNTKHVVLPSR